MDWLSIIIAILVFVLPAIFEGDKKKKKRKEAHLPHPVEDPDLMEMPSGGGGDARTGAGDARPAACGA